MTSCSYSDGNEVGGGDAGTIAFLVLLPFKIVASETIRNDLLNDDRTAISFPSSQNGGFYWRSPGDQKVFELFTREGQVGGGSPSFA